MKNFWGSLFVLFLFFLGLMSCQQRYAYRNTYRVHTENKQEKLRRDQVLAFSAMPVSSEPFPESNVSTQKVPLLIIAPSNLQQRQRDLPIKQFGSKQKIGSNQHRIFTRLPLIKPKQREHRTARIQGKNKLVYLSAALLVLSVLAIAGGGEMIVPFLLLVFAIVSLVSITKDWKQLHRIRILTALFFLLALAMFGVFAYIMLSEISGFLVGEFVSILLFSSLCSLLLMRIFDGAYFMSRPFLYWSLRILILIALIVYLKFPDYLDFLSE